MNAQAGVTRGRLGLTLAALVMLLGCEQCTNLLADCSTDEDCPAGQSCNNGTCGVEDAGGSSGVCSLDSDCDGGRCVQNRCQAGLPTDGGTPRHDAGHADAGSGLGVLDLTPYDVVDFGAPLPPPQTISKSITLQNVGEGPLMVLAVARTSDTSAEYVVTPSLPVPARLAIGQSMHIDIEYGMTDGEPDLGAVAITSDAHACSFNCVDPQNVRVGLTSQFKGTANLLVDPTLHDFGFVQAPSASSPFSFTVSNEATNDRVLTISNVTFSGDVDQFEYTPPTLPAYLQPLGTLPLTLSYKPNASASHSAQLVVQANSDNPERQEITVTIRGHSVPIIEVTVDAHDFGECVEVGQRTNQATTIHNNSNITVTIEGGDFDSNGAQGFTLPTPAPFPITMPANSTAQLPIYFKPLGQAGTRADVLHVRHDQSSSDVVAEITGCASPPPPPPGGPKLDVAMTFSRDSANDLSACPSGVAYNNQNMDLILEGGGGSCEKPQNVGGQCPTDAYCQCSFGSQGGGEWRASGGSAPEPYAVERISHNGQGGDGTFIIKNRYWDGCAAVLQSGNTAALQALCDYYPCECYPEAIYPDLYVTNCGGGDIQTCAGNDCIVRTQCYYQAAFNANRAGQCVANGQKPSTAKTLVVIKSAQGAVVEQRAFCLAFSSASQTNKVPVVGLIREQGFFRVGALSPGVVEVGAAEDCP